ncbi:MAG: VIT domain-containing protein [Candidatus Odinarchaeota archaeon]
MKPVRIIITIIISLGLMGVIFNSFAAVALPDGSGFIVILNPAGLAEKPKITIHNVTIHVKKNYAITQVYEEFVNPYEEPVSGTFYFPLPENSLISNFSLKINGSTYYAECKPLEQAREEYEQAEAEGREAAILEYVAPNMFAYSISIGANSSLGVGLEYEQLIELKHGKYRYSYAMDMSGQGLPADIGVVNLDFELDGGNQRIMSLNTSFIDMSETAASEYRKKLTYQAENLVPDKNFVVDYQLEIGGLAGNLMTYTNGDERYFLYSLAPDPEELGMDGYEGYLGKNIIFVVDKSGSMGGTKMSQVKQAMLSIVQNLNEQDKFNIVTYESSVSLMSQSGMVMATNDNIISALDFINNLNAGGGTNINDALVTALGLFTESLPGLNLVVFMTDGQPTAGITEPETIVQNVIDHNEHSAVIYSFGFGIDLNFDLLEKISHTTGALGGEAFQVDPSQENIELELVDFYKVVENPLMSQIKLSFTSSDADISDTVPRTETSTTNLETLFQGSEKLVSGMMNTSATNLSISLTALVGELEGFTVSHTFDLVLTESTDFVERLHASRKIDELLDIIDFITNEGLLNTTIEKIVTIALKYGFATPYTALLVDPSVMPPVEGKETCSATGTGVLPSPPTETHAGNSGLDNYVKPSPGFEVLELIAGLVLVFVAYRGYRKSRRFL